MSALSRSLSPLGGIFVALLLIMPLAGPVAAADHPSSGPRDLTRVGTRIFFTAETASHDRELWVTDGTAAGTHEVKDINPTGSSWPMDLTPMGGKLYFFADDGTGYQLWKSDGTIKGTKPLGGGNGGYSLTNVQGTLFFISESTVWKSNGTVAGTKPVAGVEGSDPWIGAVAFKGRYYFFASLDYETSSLWRSNGTPAGTSEVASVDVDYESGATPSDLMRSGDRMYFRMVYPYTGIAPAELWQSDGTALGTRLVRHFSPDPEELDSVAWGMANMEGTLFFSVKGELWKTDGTELGTRRVKSIDPGWDPAMAPVGSRLFLFADDGTGTSLWRSRGTPKTTIEVYPIAVPGCRPFSDDPYCSLDQQPVAVAETLFFPAAQGGNGTELWASDGTFAGTHMVKDIAAGSSRPSDLASDGRRLFFSAKDGMHGRELWVSNGTVGGTFMVMDINPG